MQTTITTLALAAGVSLACCQSAGAMSASGTVVKQAATTASTVQFVRVHHKAHTARSNAATARGKGSTGRQ